MAINKPIEMHTPEAEFGEFQSKPSRRKWPAILIIIIILAALALTAYYLNIIPSSLFPQLHKSYQAVFLTNGQVYF